MRDEGVDQAGLGDAGERDAAWLTLASNAAGFDALLEYLRRNRGFDFLSYTRATLSRRIHRRMEAVGVAQYDAYIHVLEREPDELPRLFDSILINVTGFFRDPVAWDLVRRLVQSRLGAHDAGTPFRVWCAGCASGEEPYSLAMLLAELVGTRSYLDQVKIYATDIDPDALAEARLATYSADAVEAVPEALRAKYFRKVGKDYALDKDIRRAVIFGRHDLAHDAAISRIDLLTCRNTLMYFTPDVQARILERLHFALNETGILVVGQAETLLSHASLFTPVDLKLRVFERTRRRMRSRPLAQEPPESDVSLADLGPLYRSAFERGPSAQIVLDRDGRVALVNARARQLFSLTAEDICPPLHALEIACPPGELRSCLDRVKREQRPVHLREVERTLDTGEKTYLDIELTPLVDGAGAVLGTQLSFEDITVAHHFQGELRETSIELETAHDEIHSTSQELETMNEELQSTNQELMATSDELRERSEELAKLGDFMSATFAKMPSGVVVLDRDLLVPIAALAQAIHARLAHRDGSEPTLECTDAHGNPIRCRVRITPATPNPNRGVTMVIEELVAR